VEVAARTTLFELNIIRRGGTRDIDRPSNPEILMAIFQDLRFAGRMLLKDRWFTSVAALALGLGIGVNTTVSPGRPPRPAQGVKNRLKTQDSGLKAQGRTSDLSRATEIGMLFLEP
jgi:hypothetical protein